MHLKYLVFVSLIGLFMASCSLIPNEMEIANKMMEEHPDSALHILRNMKSASTLPEADRAMYGLLLFKALDKNNLPLQPDSILNFTIRYYQKTSDNDALSFCYFFKARMYKMVQRHEEATVLYLKSLDLFHKSKNNEFLGKIYADMGDISTYQRELNDARKKFETSLFFFTRANNQSEAFNRLLDIGRSYHLAKNYSTALVYYNKVLRQSKDSVLSGGALQEIGINFYWDRKLDSAEYYLKKSLFYPYQSTNYAIRLYTLADVSFDMGNYNEARNYALKALKYPANFFTKRDCYRILANTEYKQNNFQLMGVYIAKYQDCVDSVRKVEIQTKSTFLENLHETELAANKTKSYLSILSWLLPAIALVVLLLIVRIRKRNQRNQLELKLEIHHKKNQLIHNKSQLKASLMLHIVDAKMLQLPVYKKATLFERDELTKELYKNCLHTDNWEKYCHLMNRILNNLLIKLENEIPEINRKELMWCGLYLIEIEKNDMALLLDCKSDSLYKLKQRVVQKFQLKSVKDLDAYFQKIIHED